MLGHIDVQRRFAFGQEQLVGDIDVWFSEEDGGYFREARNIAWADYRPYDPTRHGDIVDALEEVLRTHLPREWEIKGHQTLTVECHEGVHGILLVHLTGDLVLHRAVVRRGIWENPGRVSLRAAG